MNAFLVDMENRPGELARIAEALGNAGVNISGITGATSGGRGRVALITSDASATTSVLREAGWTFNEVEMAETTMPNEPGSLGRVARRLADAGVNIEALMPTGMSGGNVDVGFVTDNPARAREALSGAGASS